MDLSAQSSAYENNTTNISKTFLPPTEDYKTIHKMPV